MIILKSSDDDCLLCSIEALLFLFMTEVVGMLVSYGNIVFLSVPPLQVKHHLSNILGIRCLENMI